MPEYIPIADFAKLANVTTQSIYQRLGKDLAPYCKVVGKLKTIDIQALSLYQENSSCKDAKESCKVANDVAKDACKEVTNNASEFASYLQAENERLRSVLTAKEEKIAEKDALLASYAERFAALAEREQEISARALQTTGQAQLLHANTQEDEADKPKKKWLARIFG